MAVHVYNKMTDLLSWLQSPQIPYASSNCQDAMHNAADKLADYVTGNKQPAIKLFQSVRAFDPRQLPLLSKTFHDHSQVVPALMAAAEEWQTYLDVAERETIDENISLCILDCSEGQIASPISSGQSIHFSASVIR